MTVICEGPLCLKIQLNRFELKKYFTSYDKIVFSDPRVKKTLFFLLDTVCDNFKFEKHGNLLIEVFPTPHEGCVLKYTCTPSLDAIITPYNTRLKSKKTIYTFKFNSFEDLVRLSLAYINKESFFVTQCQIYLVNKHYYLIAELLNTQISLALLINEYSNYCARGKYPAELVKEYGRCIINNNALQKVGKSFKEL